jgi:hypothetical protein
MSYDRRAKLLEKRAKIEAQIKAIEARDNQRKRKEDTRRKIIAGALALEHADIDPAFGAMLAKLLNRYVTRPQDRRLFDLPERPPPAPANEFAPAARPRGMELA